MTHLIQIEAFCRKCGHKYLLNNIIGIAHRCPRCPKFVASDDYDVVCDYIYKRLHDSLKTIGIIVRSGYRLRWHYARYASLCFKMVTVLCQ